MQLNRNINRRHSIRYSVLGPGAAARRNNNASVGRSSGGSAVSLDRVVDNNAKLSRCPKSLYVLWDEWTTGIGGMKAARLFNSAERGKCKHTFSKRRIFWDKVSELTRAGMASDLVIDKIYQAYGEGESVTNVLKAMQKDKPHGGHPNLQLDHQTE